MSVGSSDQGSIRLSLLDRLIDHDPTNSQEVPPTNAERLRIVRQSLKRDLEDLLNTRFRCVSWPPELNQLDDSLINYGIPDFTAASLSAADDSDILVTALRRAIELFEPRLTDVRVKPTSSGEDYDRMFRFRIEGFLTIEDGDHRVKFDSSMESTTGQFDIN
jgi:type VI secretion system protein ImpF